ncbi:MAG: peptidase [Cyanobacteria bacterium SW_9_44_58]|nr:MAG: peptidase [Cyanobacteria bacterium SW_9_44_58]
MAKQTVTPYGSWKSPITSDLIVSESIGLGGVIYDSQDIYWLEGRPSEEGRYVLVRRTPQGTVEDVTPQPYNVRTRVHEYGGGAFLVAEGTIYFVHFDDQRLYRKFPYADPEPLTPEGKRSYAEPLLDSWRDRLICICEDNETIDAEPRNYIASIDLNTGKAAPLVSGCDFYVSPRLSPDGKTLAWVQWNHPNMPWDDTELCIGTIDDEGMIRDIQVVAGGKEEAVCHPLWSPDGQLYFVSDRTNWWNLYRLTSEGEIESLFEMEAEFAFPHWVFGLSLYDFVSPEQIVCTYTQNGQWYLATLNTKAKTLKPLDVPYTDIGSIHTEANEVVFVAGSATEPTSVVEMNIETGKSRVLKKATNLDIDPGYLSVPEPIAFPTTGEKTAYAWFYPPQNKDYRGPDGELPPLIVKSHGGPTAATSPRFNLKIQYWTSRGFGFVDVNYGGSTGYGREYRQRLRKNWGIVDVDDCVNAAKYLAQTGKADGNRLAITGGSAGGYTTLAALTFRDTFQAGASHYGVSDLEALAQETHKFESRYLDQLVGQYPDEKEIYHARSPIYHTEKLSCPVIFFQGLEDKVVPPNQAEKMVEVIKQKGLSTAYVPFKGEQHGFRRAENIKRALDGEFYFYSCVFGFTPAEDIEPVEIMNL